ncbi:uncharacterized protein ATC70_010527 [Mucor velutinosus]|uniref:Poly [ADP-ribose] polymerase n=1 Tax=Mucor velutinosus TaxID=708070 RepID=A0AAN7DIK5_9FUNG|nr:hypothetical protein ATC70_010527 [Mucor velutinosus]
MTKSSPPPSPTRTNASITRRSTRVLNNKDHVGIKKSNVLINKRTKSKDLKHKKIIKKGLNASPQPVRIRITDIRDFKKQFGLISYLVRREGYIDDMWVTESAIENLDVVQDYHRKVQAESGYSIIESDGNTDMDVEGPSDNQQQEEEGQEASESNHKRPSRTSKIRAVLALKQARFMDEDEDEDVSHGKKRKSTAGGKEGSAASTNGGNKKRATGSGTGRKTKAQVLLEQQAEDRLERKREREVKDGEAILRSMDHVEGKDCCLKCAANTYRHLLEKGDLEGFKKCFQDARNIPFHHHEDIPNGLHLIPYAIVLEKFDFAEFATKFKPDANAPTRPVVPNKYFVYDNGTGHNRGGGAYGSRNFRQVQESRGNRLGNSAFYGKGGNSLPRKSYMNVEDSIGESGLSAYMPYINKDVFKKSEVINNFLATITGNEAKNIYFVVASGNRVLASQMIEENVKSMGRNTFNHLHEQVLKYDGSQALESYRRPQILKKAFDACNLTPYHCSAIHPAATYLSELFEALDHAERLETDVYGRSVAFYAAVSDTSACMEFLISKNFNVTMHDKFKMTPLIQAARYGKSANVEILIRLQRGDETETPVAVFQSLLRNRRTALHYAAYFGHAETCRVLIQYNCPVDALENLDKQTPLHYAAKNGYLDCVRVLIEEGHANPEKDDKYARNALHLACIYGHLDIVHYLLSIGVDANAPDSSQNYPTHYAAAYGYIDILHLLIEYGSADPTLPNVWTSTPCSVANMKGHIAIVKYLLQLPGNPIDVNFKDQEGCSMLQRTIDEAVVSDIDMELNLSKAKLLLSMHADVNSKDLEGYTSLHHLAANTAFAKLLPKGYQCIYPEKKQGYGYRVLKNTTGHAQDDMDGINYQLDMAKLLIEHGADLDAKSLKNETPLATAMRNKNHSLVAVLIKAGSKFWLDVDEEGNTFLHYYAVLAARINSIRAHGFEENIVRRQRFEKAIQDVWQAAQDVIKEKGIDFKEIINKPNHKGYSFFVWGFRNAVVCEKTTMVSEKRLVSSALTAKNQNTGTYGYYSHDQPSWISSKKIDDYEGVLVFDFRLDFSFFIACMQKILSVAKPDLNDCVALPKDFKKEKPQAKRTDYPVLTGYTALHFACQTQCVDLIDFVLRSGADPNTRVKVDDWLGDTPMLMVCHIKKDKKQEMPNNDLETVELLNKKFILIKPDFEEMLQQSMELLIKYKACPFIANAHGITPLFKAASKLNRSLVQMMCADATPSRGTDINVQDERNQTALTVALDAVIGLIDSNKEVNTSVIKALLMNNANPNIVDESKETAFTKVIRTSHVPLVKVFLHHSAFPLDHNCQNKNLETALSIACKLNNKDILFAYLDHLKETPDLVKTTINAIDVNGWTALSHACKHGNATAIDVLLSKLGADANISQPQHVPLCEAVKSGNIESVQHLLEHGAFINQCDENQNTPLHNAVLVQKHHIVELLLKHAADCHLVNAKQQVPLHLAIDVAKKQTNRSFRVERALLKKGADINATDFLNRTPLHYAFVDSNTIPLTRDTILLQKKMKLVSQEIKQEQEKQEKLASYATEFDLHDHANNDSMAQVNSWLKNAKLVRLNQELDEEKKKAASNNHEDLYMTEEEKHQIRAYHTFHFEAEKDIPERFDPVDIFKFLSQYQDLKLDLLDAFSRNPLHYAACVGAFSCSTLMIGKGVDMNVVDSDNNNALQLALRNNYIDYSVMLCNMGASVKLNMTLRDGTIISTLGYSLSKSLINVAYLIMDQGSLLIESIRDALQNGKFQMVELLLNSVDEAALSEFSTKSGQNMWHVLADFNPFDREIWLDYIDEFVAKVKAANPPIIKDSFGRTPLHYAAMHGQDLLLDRLIQFDAIGVNYYDIDGKSELDYAVESCQVDCLTILLNAGAIVTKSSASTKSKSVLLHAVENQQYDITALLLKHTALTDDGDSENGWPNAVMMACQQKNLAMLKLLVSHQADPNTPSHIERTDKDGKVIKLLIHPIFIASQISDVRFIETLLKAGASPNVYGPCIEPENGQSCFMYNVSLKHVKHQEILLSHHVDVNAIDPTTKRSIFYQFFFGLMPAQSSHLVRKPSPFYEYDTTIYEKMLQLTSGCPQVNQVDPFTNMTPLEFAIRDKKPLLLQRLLSFGADPNVQSCANSTNTSFAHVANPRGVNLPAYVHAIIQGNMDILVSIFDMASSKFHFDFEWKDDQGNNLLSYADGIVSGHSHCNVNIMKRVADQLTKPLLNKLLRMKNAKGIAPIVYAYRRQDKTLYKLWVELVPSIASFAVNNYSKDDFPQHSAVSPMEVDHISLVQVDHDAQIEREHLQHLKDLEKAQDASAQSNEEDDKLKVDLYANLSKVGVLAMDASDQPYDIMLMKVELKSWGSTDTSFYKLSVIFNKVLSVYVLWTRWGPFGQEGQHQKTPFLTKEEAVVEFKSIFKAKTGNNWEGHDTSFEPKPNRYEIMKIAHHPKDAIIDNFDFLDSSVPSDLTEEIANVMKLICNYTYLSRVYSDTRIDMPLGQVPQKRIEDARDLLNETYELIKTYKQLKSCYSDKAKIQESKVYAFKIAQKCVAYSRLLPRHGEANQAIRSLYNHDNSVIRDELSKLADLSYVGFAANVILAAKHHVDSINPLDYAFRTLDCSLKSMSPSDDLNEYQLVTKYMNSTSKSKFDLVHLFAVNRADEAARFRPFEKEANRKLLWHGSRVGNFMGILKQGLRATPRTSSKNGALLGDGIYFADTFSKSLNYSTEIFGSHRSAYRLMLLCEVALGKEKVYGENSGEIDQECDSMKGKGQNIPDPENTVYDESGLCVPIGPCIPNTQQTTQDTQNQLFGYSAPVTLNFNEWAVYNEHRVKIRYLLIIKEANSCSLCLAPNVQKHLLKPYRDQKFNDYNFKGFNVYESEVVKAYLTHANKTPQDIYKEDVEHFVSTKAYKNKWDTPLDLQKDSKICYDCAKKITTVLLDRRISRNKESNKIIAKINKKPRCKYGKECRTQSKIDHAAKYKHWFMKNISDAPLNPLMQLMGGPLSRHSDLDDDDYKSEDIEDTNEESNEEEGEDHMDTDDDLMDLDDN